MREQTVRLAGCAAARLTVRKVTKPPRISCVKQELRSLSWKKRPTACKAAAAGAAAGEAVRQGKVCVYARFGPCFREAQRSGLRLGSPVSERVCGGLHGGHSVPRFLGSQRSHLPCIAHTAAEQRRQDRLGGFQGGPIRAFAGGAMRHASEPWWHQPRMDRLGKHFATASSVPVAGARVVGEDRPSVNSALLYFPLPRELALTESPIFALRLSRKPMALQNWMWSRLAGSGHSRRQVGLHQSVTVSRGTPCSNEKNSDGAQQMWRFLRSVPLGTHFLATIGVIGW